jgi:hypothetical protein
MRYPVHAFRRKAALSLTLAAGLTGGLLGVASPAAASSETALPSTEQASATAVSCYIVCDGQDPSTAVYEDSDGVLRRCNDARTIYEIEPSASGWVELRYSRKCRMAWARGGGGIKVQGFNADGSFRVAYEKFVYPGQAYTLAVNDAGLTARACLEIPWEGWSCTATY